MSQLTVPRALLCSARGTGHTVSWQKGDSGVDPVVAGVVATVLVSIVSGVVRVARHRLSAEVELARIADAGTTERVRHTVPWGTLRERTEGRQVTATSHRSGGDRDGGLPQR